MYTDKPGNIDKTQCWTMLYKWACNCENFWVIAFQVSELSGHRDPDSGSCGVPVFFYQNNIVWIKAWIHGLSRHFVSNDQCLLLLSLDGKQHLVSYFSNAVLGVDMDHSWGAVVWGISKRAVVHYTHSCHFLNGWSHDRNTENTRRKIIHL